MDNRGEEQYPTDQIRVLAFLIFTLELRRVAVKGLWFGFWLGLVFVLICTGCWKRSLSRSYVQVLARCIVLTNNKSGRYIHHSYVYLSTYNVIDMDRESNWDKHG